MTGVHSRHGVWGRSAWGASRTISMLFFARRAISSSTSRVAAPLLRARSRALTKRWDISLTTRRIAVFLKRGGSSGQAVSLYCFMIPTLFIRRHAGVDAAPAGSTAYGADSRTTAHWNRKRSSFGMRSDKEVVTSRVRHVPI
jgi:hypothetical protein